MAIMFGNGVVKPYTGSKTAPKYIMKTETFTISKLPASTTWQQITGTNGNVDTPFTGGGWSGIYTAPDGKTYKKQNPKFYTAEGNPITAVATTTPAEGTYYWPMAEITVTSPETNKGIIVSEGEKVFCTYDLNIDGSVIEISANSFPGTYYITGDKLHNCLLAA